MSVSIDMTTINTKSTDKLISPKDEKTNSKKQESIIVSKTTKYEFVETKTDDLSDIEDFEFDEEDEKMVENMEGSLLSKNSREDGSNPNNEMYYNSSVLDFSSSKNSLFGFGLASHYMMYGTCILSVLFGACAVYYYYKNVSDAVGYDKQTSHICGYYCIITGIIIFIVEYCVINKYNIKYEHFLYKATVSMLIGMLPWINMITMLVGFFWVLTAIFCFMAFKNEEMYKNHVGKRGKFKFNFKQKIAVIKDTMKMRKYTVLILYLIFCGWYMFNRYNYYDNMTHDYNEIGRVNVDYLKNGNQKEFDKLNGIEQTLATCCFRNGNNMVLSGWFPIAKMFGNLLDINCAFIVFPVSRLFISFLYNKSTDQRKSSRLWRKILLLFPLDKALQSHKVMAFLVFIGILGHTFGHFTNYFLVPMSYSIIFGDTVWVSGIMLIIVSFLIFATSLVSVRKNNFELFYYTHHLFIVFFIALLFHGANTTNPNFHKWFAIPGFIYLVERIWRYYQTKKEIGVVSITHMNNKHAKVFCLELEKPSGHPISNHKEGQYVFINVPIISKYEWHPFTISSPPDSNTVELHLRNMGPETWTGKLQEFLQALSPNKSHTKLFHRHIDKLLPLKIAPDGSKFVRIDGPIAAPTQHLGKYQTSMIIGAGIGVTPLRAALLSIVYYRFKKGIGCTFPDNVYCVWIVNYHQLDSYRFMMRTLKEIEQEMFHMREKNEKEMGKKTLEIHIYVTRAPKNPVINIDEVTNPSNDANRDVELWGTNYNYIETNSKIIKYSPFTEIDLWKALKKPKKDTTTQLGNSDIFIHNGRPKWDDLFLPISKNHAGEHIGVIFCGPNIISRDLKNMCATYSHLNIKGTKFNLHKENF